MVSSSSLVMDKFKFSYHSVNDNNKNCECKKIEF